MQAIPRQRPLLREKVDDLTLERYATLPEKEKTVSRWPWEEQCISAAEYQCSLEGLQHFVEEVEVNRLQTLEDLSAVASLVGHDLLVLAVTHGKKSERKTEQFESAVGESISRIEREYVFTCTIGRLEIVVTARNGQSLLSRYSLLGFQGYQSEELSVSLPSDRDIAMGEKPNVDEHSMYATDVRWRGNRVYYPTQEPESPEIQQVFARLLKEALSTLREVFLDWADEFLAQCCLQRLDDGVNSQKRKKPFSFDKNKHRQHIDWHGTLYIVRDSLCIERYLIEDDPMAEDSPIVSPKESGQKRTTRRDLPTGTVTLLFTDIEGSTNLLQQLGEPYAEMLTECHQLLRTAFSEHHGHEVDTQGDGFFVVFVHARDAILATVAAQHVLTTHSWPEGVVVRVRMGLHTSELPLVGESYVGLDAHYAARIAHAAHGGQVLLSQTTHDLVESELPFGVSLRDLGKHRLKDLQRPIHLYQLLNVDLPADFPPLKTLDSLPNNLPVQLTPLIGREKEVAAVQYLLNREDVRLVTLTGPGGMGKTRLGLQVAAELSNLFADGVYFVNLAPLSDPELVVPTIAQTLGLKEASGQSLFDLVNAWLRERHLLLLLDNFEQVVSAAVRVADLLAACSNLKVLVTSRMTLHIRGEQEFPVPPLAVPDPQHLPDLVELPQYEAVAFFVSRAQATKPTFQLTAPNAHAVAEICVRLDGLPLAIELAAARIKLLPPKALLARLGQRLAVLTGGAKDVPARQQTLRDTIEWSYDLLDGEEQLLFRRLSVFVGGYTLQAVEAIGAALDGEAGRVIEEVASLLDQSLLQQTESEGEEPRLTMLETIREYGLECLRESGEAKVSQRAHALYYLALAEEAAPHLKSVQQVLWWRRLELEQENLRAALTWLIGQEEDELALRLSGALWWFWNIRGYWSEGWHWLEVVLGLPQTQGRTAKRAKVLYEAAEFANSLRNPVVYSFIEECVAIYHELGDKRGLAESLADLGLSRASQNDIAVARTLLEESLVFAREVGDSWVLANVLRNMGEFMHVLRDYKSARLYLEESVMLYRELKDYHALSRPLRELVEVTMFEGQVKQAAALAQENLALSRELDNGPDISRALYCLALTKSFQGDDEQAVALLEESLKLAREQGDKRHMGDTLLALGSIAVQQKDLLQAETWTQECLMLFRERRDNDRTLLALSVLGDIRRIQRELTQAKEICKEAVLLAMEAGNPYSQGWSLISLARVVADEGQPEQAARLFGAAEPWLNPTTEMDPVEHADYDRAVEGVRSQLDEKAFATPWAEGRGMTPEQALATQIPKAESISGGASLAPSAKLPTTSLDGLSVRELEVLRLLAQGLTDAQIAEQLVLSLHTVHAHLRTIYSKLGVTSRSAATRYAFEHQLV